MTENKPPADLMRRTLRDGEVELRPLVARDAGELFMMTDRHRATLRQFMAWVDQTTSVADMNYYILSLDGFWKAGITYGVHEGGSLWGTVGFHHTDMRHDKAEIGYWLSPDAHGRGLGTRSVRMAIEAAYQYTSVNRIEAKIAPENIASRKLVEKLGFQFEGVERQGVRFGKNDHRDNRIYSLLRADFS